MLEGWFHEFKSACLVAVALVAAGLPVEARSANRGYENRYGVRANSQGTYRHGFEAGYAEGYRVYACR